MRTLLGTTLGVIAVGVMLIAYGLLNPRTVATAPTFADGTANGYQFARPVSDLSRGASVEDIVASAVIVLAQSDQRRSIGT